ncbi:hypothetical protein [Crossiella cryophila]|uniref:Uncharacterized protein n=1 Tax=Crossiella cryophila TaxID=43355 RepID=A0A7W7CJS1_9PSEU|nr:hypothetical protein [Crossiella cryophila]MBB4682514.1 hypothetical protein [Crossiella cryophila]
MRNLMIIGTPAHPLTGKFGPSGHGINGNGGALCAGVNSRVGLAARRYAQFQGTTLFTAWAPTTVTTLIPSVVDVPNTDERRTSALERSP